MRSLLLLLRTAAWIGATAIAACAGDPPPFEEPQVDDGASDGGVAEAATPGDDAAATAKDEDAGLITVMISDLPFEVVANGSGPVEKDTSIGENVAGDGKPITLNGTVYPKGLGVHPESRIKVALDGKYRRFISDVGIDDEVAAGSVTFVVYVDGILLYDSGVVAGGATPTKTVDVAVNAATELELVVTSGGDNLSYDHADWAGARLTR